MSDFTDKVSLGKLALTLFLLTFGTAFADGEKDCPTHNVDTSHMAQGADQGDDKNIEKDTLLCQSFTASDLLSFHIKKSLLPYDVAFQMFVGRQMQENEQAKSEKREPEKVQFFQGKSSENASIIEVLNANSGQDVCLNPDLTPDDFKSLSTFIALFRKQDSDQGICKEYVGTDKLKKWNVDLKKVLERKSNLGKLQQTLSHVCKEKVLVDLNEKFEFQTRYVDSKYPAVFSPNPLKSTDETLKQIKDVIRRDHPMGIEYDSSAIFKGGGGHASTVVGMYYDKTTKQCMFRIKNSSGAKCDTNLANGAACDKVPGYYVVPAEKLAAYTARLTWINPLKK